MDKTNVKILEIIGSVENTGKKYSNIGDINKMFDYPLSDSDIKDRLKALREKGCISTDENCNAKLTPQGSKFIQNKM